MHHRSRISLRALLILLLAAGPLQAQTIFACAMMDTVVHDRCCCEDHGTDGLVPEPAEEPCCERSLGVTVDQDGSHGTIAKTAAEVRLDADPPPVLLAASDTLLSPPPSSGPAFYRVPVAAHSGSDTWLITRRLRI